MQGTTIRVSKEDARSSDYSFGGMLTLFQGSRLRYR